ncbi:efflux RND transporter periplasmic adaptor subunit [Vibrio superstes]|uniref:Hemolysin secretion protein D n=1 Tax=Vibrio superstes NBRC 103154 TaxID=1219062 RepID=A0A511QRC6_9VIBR|nr:efflux RND transporter periplasmic adaptor subunit [Vibrio superstes]GEM79898.1 hemolysin secretion protein D [Vibrio superstes NBRC 103154]
MNNLNTTTAQKFRPTAIAVAMSLTVFLAGCKSESEVVALDPVVRPVFTEVVSTVEVSDLSFSGTVHSASRADLSFRTSGRIVEMLIKEGDSVEENQVIAKLDSVDAQLALTSAHNELMNARAEYQRAKTLFERQQSISKSQFEELTLRFRLAENHYAEAERRLDDTNLRAPFAGVISRTFVDNHVLVQSNEMVVSLHDLNNLEAEIHVPESVMTRDSGALKTFARSSIIPNETYELTLKKYETEPDPVTGTYSITFSVATSENSRLLPGMRIQLYSSAEQLDSKEIQIPLTAINPDNLGNQYVWVVDNENVLRKRTITTGSLNGERVAIESNLQLGEQIVVSGTQNLQEGLVVQPEIVEAQ